MSEHASFSGFPPEGLRFLSELAANNNREWYEEHKQDYRRYVVEPALIFVEILGQRLQQEISSGIIYDTRTNGSGSLMRIHRDTRFSEDKTPYKTHVGLMFWEGPAKKLENPGFMLHLDPTGGEVYGGVYMFSKPLLTAYRTAVLDENLGSQLTAALETVQGAGGYTTGGEHYKRVPRGFDADHERADLLRYNGLHASSPRIDTGAIISPELVELCLQHCRAMAPLQQWLVQMVQRCS